MSSQDPTDVSALAYADACVADLRALRAARKVGLPVSMHGASWEFIRARLLREARYARAVADRYRIVAARRGIRASAGDAGKVVDTLGHMA